MVDFTDQSSACTGPHDSLRGSGSPRKAVCRATGLRPCPNGRIVLCVNGCCAVTEHQLEVSGAHRCGCFAGFSSRWRNHDRPLWLDSHSCNDFSDVGFRLRIICRSRIAACDFSYQRIPPAEYLDTFAPVIGGYLTKSDVMATNELGRLSYWTEAQVEDMSGLTNPTARVEASEGRGPSPHRPRHTGLPSWWNVGGRARNRSA